MFWQLHVNELRESSGKWMTIVEQTRAKHTVKIKNIVTQPTNQWLDYWFIVTVVTVDSVVYLQLVLLEIVKKPITFFQGYMKW